MTASVVATDSTNSTDRRTRRTDGLDGPTNASAQICDYLDARVEAGDTIHAVNSKLDDDGTDAEEIRFGGDVLNVVSSRRGGVTTVETRQFVRGNAPEEDVLEQANAPNADEIGITLRHRTPAGKAPFGSVTQSVMLNSERPVVSVPRS